MYTSRSNNIWNLKREKEALKTVHSIYTNIQLNQRCNSNTFFFKSDMLLIVVIVELKSCCTFMVNYGNTQLNLKFNQG